MYARRQGGKELTFDFAEGLVDNNLLVVDRETSSIWSQLAGQAIAGEMDGTPLAAIPAQQLTWRFWRREHPDTRVMVLKREGRPYRYDDFVPGEKRRSDGHHDVSTLGLGVAIGNDARFFPLPQLALAETPMAIEVGSQPMTVHYDADGLTAWATDASGELMMTVLAYESGWRSFFPGTRIWTASE